MDRARILLVGLVALSACGAGTVAKVIRPEDPSTSKALGDEPAACDDVSAGGEPLVVDWRPDQRGDLELAMREGVAVVAYDCEGLRLLADCRIEGSYGFLGMTRKEQVVRLQNAGEIRANLPVSKGAIGGEATRADSLDVAMIMIGKRRTTWHEPTTADLRGQCAGATHWVRGATVGAFVVEMSAAAKVRTAAEMFEIGASAGSESQKQARSQDGDPAECAASTPEASAPPAQCGAPIRLALAPIRAAGAPSPVAAAPAATRPSARVEHSCPAGLVLAQGKCTTAAAAPAYQCAGDDEQECATQCDAGHAGSCRALAEIFLASDRAPGAAPLLARGCDGDDPDACVMLGRLGRDGVGTGAAAPPIAELFERGCAGGSPDGCEELGVLLASRKGSAERALGLFRQACEGGKDTACAQAAKILGARKGQADREAAVALHERACHGTVAESCGAVGRLHETRSGALAEPFFRRACFASVGEACFDLGRVEAVRDLDRAKPTFERACLSRSDVGCAALVIGWGEKRAVIPDAARRRALDASCTAGDARDCVALALLDAAAGNAMGKPALARACQRGDAFACAMSERAP
jgi:hypothetical protein